MRDRLLRLSLALAFVLSLGGWALAVLPAAADSAFANPAFGRTWERTDGPVKSGAVSRSWIWGPQPNSAALAEPYDQAPGGSRTVQYFDKTRMEDNSYRGANPWDVTNGLLAKELITGNLQLGDDHLEGRQPAVVNIAGDPNDPNGPSYASYAGVMANGPDSDGALIDQTIDRAGTVGRNAAYDGFGVTAVDRGAPTNHSVASVFWAFMTSSGTVSDNGAPAQEALFPNPFYATGYPLTEAYWATVLVGGVPKQVLTQVFERRVLTYTPSNPDGWQVEAGNVGLHYYQWRYSTGGNPPANTGTGNNPAPPTTGSGTQPPPATGSACLSADEQAFLNLINAYRAQNGLGSLAVSAALTRAARLHSQDMGTRNYFSHDTASPLPPGASGPSYLDRIDDAGYPGNRTASGENIAAGQATAQIVFDGWRNSPGHNANMLSPNFKAIGIGFATVPGSAYTYYWTTDFGGIVDAAPGC